MRIVIGGGREVRCVYCRDGFGPDDEAIRCLSCDTALHRDCRDELSRCPTVGCVARWSDRSRARPAEREPGVVGVAGPAPVTRAGRVGRWLLAGALLLGGGVLFSTVRDRYLLSEASSQSSDAGHIARLAELWRDGDAEQRATVERGLTHLRFMDVLSLVPAFADQSNLEVRSFGAKVIATHVHRHPGTADAVVRALKRTSGERRIAAEALAQLHRRIHLAPYALQALRGLCARGGPDARHAAKALIHHHPSTETLQYLARLMTRTTDARLGHLIAAHLAGLRGAGWPAAEVLHEGLRSRRPRVQQLCAIALQGAGAGAAVARDRLRELAARPEGFDPLDGLTRHYAQKTLQALENLSTAWLLERASQPKTPAPVVRAALEAAYSEPKELGAALDLLARRAQVPSRLPFADDAERPLKLLLKGRVETGGWFAALCLSRSHTETRLLAQRLLLQQRVSEPLRLALEHGSNRAEREAAALLAKLDHDAAHEVMLWALTRARVDALAQVQLLQGLQSEQVRWTPARRSQAQRILARIRSRSQHSQVLAACRALSKRLR